MSLIITTPSAPAEPFASNHVGTVDELIYKSIRDRLAMAVTSGDLFRWKDTEEKPEQRFLYVGHSITGLLRANPQPATFARVDLIRLLNNFVRGWSINVSLDPDNKNAELKPLHGGRGVWSCKVRRPKPGWRFLGIFACCDHFVVLTPGDREILGNDWSAQISNCCQQWDEILARSAAHAGGGLSDFISEPYYDCK